MENKHHNFQCPCCNYFTLPEKPSNTFEICPVCYWEDDGLQLDDPNYVGGANSLSLNQARKNFRKFGVSDLRLKSKTRLASAEEQPD